MTKFGYFLITFGFLAAALATVTDELQVLWPYFAAGIVAGIIGIVLVRRSQRQVALHEDVLTANIQSLQGSLEQIVEKLNQLNRDIEKIDLHKLPERIDALLIEPINAFVNSRASIGHVFGLQSYADVMHEFASGERYLNRVWSAAADGYIDEAHDYLQRSETQFHGALEKLRSLESRSEFSRAK